MSSMDEKRRNDRIDKLIDTQEKFINTVTQIFFSSKSIKSSDVSLKKDRFLVKKDLTTELMKKDNALLNKILKVNTENLKVNKSKKNNLLWNFGKLLSIGGLAGFLLTGKEEHLFSVAKALTKYLPTKILLKPLELIFKPLKALFKFAGGIGDLLKPIGKTLGKGVSKSFKSLKELFKFVGGIGDLLKPIGKTLGKGVSKSLKELFKFVGGIGDLLKLITNKFEKTLGKGASKSLFKPLNELFKFVGGIGDLLKPITNIFGKTLGKGVSKSFKSLKELFKFVGDIGDLLKPIGKTLGKGVSKSFKSLKELFKFVGGIGDLLKPITNIFGKTLGKGAGKIAGKSASKSLFKKIPVVGSLLGLFFGIERFKKGDIIGGVGEIVSGVASIFPGVGTAISVVIDGLLMMKDFGIFGKQNAEMEKPLNLTSKSDIKDWPVIGSVIKAWEAIHKFTEDPMNSIKDLAEAANRFIPGLGDGIMTSVGWIEALKNSAPAKFIGKGIDKVKNFGSNVIDKIKDKYGPVSGIKLASRDVNLNGLNKDVYNNFVGMTNEYFEKTQKSVQVNSAYRSIEDQKRLFDTLPSGYVATPGKSMHNYGYALDINSKDANNLNSMGLLKKWGFHQPFKNKEPWHIEPFGIDRAKIRSDESEENNAQIGNPVKGNLNQDRANKNNITKYNSKEYRDKEIVVKLSLDTINKLAMRIAEETKQNVPTIKQKQNVVINSRL